MKTKDEMLSIAKQWCRDIADFLARHKLVLIVCDNAGENKSKDIKEFLLHSGSKKSFQHTS
jgi:hypothetical protein